VRRYKTCSWPSAVNGLASHYKLQSVAQRAVYCPSDIVIRMRPNMAMDLAPFWTQIVNGLGRTCEVYVPSDTANGAGPQLTHGDQCPDCPLTVSTDGVAHCARHSVPRLPTDGVAHCALLGAPSCTVSPLHRVLTDGPLLCVLHVLHVLQARVSTTISA
jgi:hypothetical protein